MDAEAVREYRGDGVADLFGDVDVGAAELEVVREGLQASGLPVSNGTVGLGMQVAPLLRLEELGTYRQGRLVPGEAAEHVRRAGGLLEPAPGRDVGPGVHQ